MFPFKLAGVVTVDSASGSPVALDEVLASIAARLKREKATHLTRTDDRISFKGGFLRLVSGWNQLVSISRGKIRVEQVGSAICVHYEVWFTQLLLVVTVMVVGFLSRPIFAAPNLTIAGKVSILAFAWLWLAGGNIAVTAFRFPRLLRRAAKVSPDAA